MRLFARQDPNFSLMLGWCTTTMLLFVTHLLLDTKLIMKLNNPWHSQALAPCGFWLFPELKTSLNSYGFFRHCQHSQTCDGHPKKHPRREIPAMFWTVATSAQHNTQLCKGLTQQWQELFVCMCSNTVFMAAFQKLNCNTPYICALYNSHNKQHLYL